MAIRAPSILVLTRDLGITRKEAKTVRGLIKGDIEPDDIDATDRWIRQCYNRPSDGELIMHAIDATIGTHGVEAMGPEIDRRFTPHYCYCNAGDVYVATIIQNNQTGSYFVGCMGTVAERLPRGE